MRVGRAVVVDDRVVSERVDAAEDVGAALVSLGSILEAAEHVPRRDRWDRAGWNHEVAILGPDGLRHVEPAVELDTGNLSVIGLGLLALARRPGEEAGDGIKWVGEALVVKDESHPAGVNAPIGA
jgi:hypothetical protein